MSSLALGIDTGGTFTDGVLFDLESKEVLAKSKVFTTRCDLTRAIDSCLGNIMRQTGCLDPGRIKMIALSTTPVSYTHLDVYKRQLCALRA